MTQSSIKVAAGVIIKRDNERGNRYFLTRRHADQHQGNKWEFPGGKTEPGESAEQTLVRELHEEVGIVVKKANLLTEVRHDYGDKVVHLLFFVVDEFEGEPTGKEGQDAAWFSKDKLLQLEFPEANKIVLDLL